MTCNVFDIPAASENDARATTTLLSVDDPCLPAAMTPTIAPRRESSLAVAFSVPMHLSDPTPGHAIVTDAAGPEVFTELIDAAGVTTSMMNCTDALLPARSLAWQATAFLPIGKTAGACRFVRRQPHVSTAASRFGPLIRNRNATCTGLTESITRATSAASSVAIALSQ